MKRIILVTCVQLETTSRFFTGNHAIYEDASFRAMKDLGHGSTRKDTDTNGPALSRLFRDIPWLKTPVQHAALVILFLILLFIVIDIAYQKSNVKGS